ncbi:MAG TPA: hypothetical protein DEB06_11735 [Phycisphaerales bacterium]|nr:hypothetical protein [Phycisphaerales bacterium]
MTPREHAIALLEFTRSYTLGLLKDIPEGRYTHQVCPTANHILWVMGHLAGTDAWIAGEVGASKVSVPEAIVKAFGMNSKPSASGNPPVGEVKRAFESSRAALIEWFKSAPDSALKLNLKEKTGGFTTDPIDAMLKIAWHEGLHAGQIAEVRKSLGLPPSM